MPSERITGIYFSDDFPADMPFRKSMDKTLPSQGNWYKRLGRFMPRKYARMRIRITGVRVERLKDISENDAVAEGIERDLDSAYYPENGPPAAVWPSHVYENEFFLTAKDSFFSLWEKINGKASLDANPWVWVYTFEMVEV